VRANEGVLGHLFGVLLIAQELVDHRENAIPIPRDHFIEGGLVAILETVYEDAVEGHFLSFCGHSFCFALMGIFLNCSHDFETVTAYRRRPRVNRQSNSTGGENSCQPPDAKSIYLRFQGAGR